MPFITNEQDIHYDFYKITPDNLSTQFYAAPTPAMFVLKIKVGVVVPYCYSEVQ